jgi:Beta-lactamase enzyme family
MKVWKLIVIGFVLSLLLAACGTPVSPAPTEETLETLSTQGELGERGFTTPTDWWWLYNVTPAQIAAKASEGYRLFDLEVNGSGASFNAVFVKNTGVHAKGWWWYYGVSDAQVSSLLSSNNARLIDQEIYYVNGVKLSAVVMIPNTGADARAWWYYSGISFATIGTLVNNNAARLVDMDSYTVNGTQLWSVVMVRNSGVDAKGWWYYAGVTSSQINSLLSANNARLTDIERLDNGTFAVIMEQSQGEGWWWYIGATEADVNRLVAQNGARVIDIERYFDSSNVRYAVIMLDNLNAQSRRMSTYMAARQANGSYGHYVKQVNGSVLAGLQTDFIFEPASTIKALHHVHAMRQVALGNTTLNTNVNWFMDLSGSCPVDTSAATGTLRTGLQAMMEQSDNRWTQAMRVRFGEANINATAQALGMTNSLVQHRIGCGSGIDGAVLEPNRLTLTDIGRLYEAVANGYLLTTSRRNTFYSLMVDGLDNNLNAVIDQEAASLGLSATKVTAFKTRVRTAAKAGNYTLGTSIGNQFYLTIGGWIKLPYKSGTTYLSREYVFGAFYNGATSISADIWANRAELLREQIRAALQTF